MPTTDDLYDIYEHIARMLAESRTQIERGNVQEGLRLFEEADQEFQANKDAMISRCLPIYEALIHARQAAHEVINRLK